MKQNNLTYSKVLLIILIVAVPFSVSNFTDDTKAVELTEDSLKYYQTTPCKISYVEFLLNGYSEEISSIRLANSEDIQCFGKINYALNSVSSSIFKSHPRHIKYNKGTISKEKKKIVIKNLKNFKSKVEKNKTLLKLDTQGYEYEILSSAKSLIKNFKMIQLETSFRKIYYLEKSWLKSLQLLEKNGFYIIDIFYGIRNSNLELMQCDLILKRFK